MNRIAQLVLMASTLLMALAVHADESDFQEGPAISGFGKIALVKTDVVIPKGAEFKVRFDVDQKAVPGTINRTFDSAARFINLHVAAGVAPEKISVAIIVHGGASFDVTRQRAYQSQAEGHENATAPAIETLRKHRVAVYLCGQSAAYHEIANADLVPGVKMALSAMTMHALLDQQGYSLNPF